jgi:alanine-glyoxylate transaminase/serine-glyoxylate transaminase/serine-pyruvate transaminase
MDRPVLDHRSPEFAALTLEILPKLRAVFGTKEGAVVLYPASGTGAWEAGLVNVLSPGDRVLSFNCGYFSAGFAQAARNLGLAVDEVPLRWGQPAPAAEVEARLRGDGGPIRYRAVLIVHNETSTGVLSDVGAIRQAMDAAAHDALLIVDAVSSLASVPFLFDEWRVDVGLAASQKGLMLPPGLAVVCASPRARDEGEKRGTPRHFFDWRPVLRDNASGFFPYTPATQLLVGLRTALEMLVDDEGLEEVFARHRRLADGVRAAVRTWGLGPLCEDPAFESQTVTTVVVPDGIDSDAIVAHARDRYGLSLGVGLGTMKARTFRIGHVGSLNDLEVIGIVAAIEMTLFELGIGVQIGAGTEACQRSLLASRAQTSPAKAPAEVVGAASWR